MYCSLFLILPSDNGRIVPGAPPFSIRQFNVPFEKVNTTFRFPAPGLVPRRRDPSRDEGKYDPFDLSVSGYNLLKHSVFQSTRQRGRMRSPPSRLNLHPKAGKFKEKSPKRGNNFSLFRRGNSGQNENGTISEAPPAGERLHPGVIPERTADTGKRRIFHLRPAAGSVTVAEYDHRRDQAPDDQQRQRAPFPGRAGPPERGKKSQSFSSGLSSGSMRCRRRIPRHPPSGPDPFPRRRRPGPE